MAVGLKVLVVEDDEGMRQLVGASLRKLGHTAELVETAEASLEVFDSGRFHLVITDLYLPGMKGDQLARIMKRQDGDLPIILLTAYPPAETPADVDSILLKPFTLDSLAEAVRRLRR